MITTTKIGNIIGLIKYIINAAETSILTIFMPKLCSKSKPKLISDKV